MLNSNTTHEVSCFHCLNENVENMMITGDGQLAWTLLHCVKLLVLV